MFQGSDQLHCTLAARSIHLQRMFHDRAMTMVQLHMSDAPCTTKHGLLEVTAVV